MTQRKLWLWKLGWQIILAALIRDMFSMWVFVLCLRAQDQTPRINDCVLKNQIVQLAFNYARPMTKRTIQIHKKWFLSNLQSFTVEKFSQRTMVTNEAIKIKIIKQNEPQNPWTEICMDVCMVNTIQHVCPTHKGHCACNFWSWWQHGDIFFVVHIFAGRIPPSWRTAMWKNCPTSNLMKHGLNTIP